MTSYTITIEDTYITPTGTFATNEDYLTFVMNKAVESYMNQYGAATVEEGITAAREMYNMSVSPTEKE